MVPTREECLRLLDQYQVPEHVLRHSLIVCTVALTLCRELNRSGEALDRDMVQAAALLHDIAKMESLRTGQRHAQIGAQWLSRLGFEEVGEIVRQHVVLDDGHPPDRITEAHLVHYADKRVRHTEIVSLAERFIDLRERYGKTLQHRGWLEKLEQQNLCLEAMIFSRIPITPESLNRLQWEEHPAKDCS
jgi:uncharacterized protein